MLFFKPCTAIEEHMGFLVKERLLEDMDGSLIQEYLCDMGSILVRNDEQVGALYVDATFDLLPFFKK